MLPRWAAAQRMQSLVITAGRRAAQPEQKRVHLTSSPQPVRQPTRRSPTHTPCSPSTAPDSSRRAMATSAATCEPRVRAREGKWALEWRPAAVHPLPFAVRFGACTQNAESRSHAAFCVTHARCPASRDAGARNKCSCGTASFYTAAHPPVRWPAHSWPPPSLPAGLAEPWQHLRLRLQGGTGGRGEEDGLSPNCRLEQYWSCTLRVQVCGAERWLCCWPGCR